MEPPGTPNHKKSRQVGTQKHIEKQHCKKLVRGRILTTKGDYPFRAGSVLKITKIRDIFKMGPQASKMSPWAPKITTNHESDTQNQENPRKKNQ